MKTTTITTKFFQMILHALNIYLMNFVIIRSMKVKTGLLVGQKDYRLVKKTRKLRDEGW